MKRRKDGRWAKTVTINKKRVFFYSTAETERQAERDIAKQLLEYAEKEEQGKTFKEVSEEWSSAHFETIEYNTQKYYRASLKQINEYFGNEMIADITPTNIKVFIDKISYEGYALKTVKSRLLVLNLIFKYAVIQRYAENNPCTYITAPKNLKKTRREAPEEEEIQVVKNSIYIEFGFFAYFILYTGLRRGEALALRYSDIDYENKLITVNKSIYHKNNVPHEKTPKTSAGIRTVVLLDNLIPLLKKRKKTDDKNELVFGNDSGRWLTNGQFQSLWENYVKQTQLKITPHQLRHAYATILYEAGIDEKDAQELMGHTTIQLTRDIYTHISKTRKKITADRLNKFVETSLCSQDVVK